MRLTEWRGAKEEIVAVAVGWGGGVLKRDKGVAEENRERDEGKWKEQSPLCFQV